MTHAGPTKRRAGIVSQALAGKSFPVIQWIGASKCVPVCSPNRSVFQYHAGPLSSYREITSIVAPGDAAKIGGSPITGVSGPSGLREIDDLQRATIRAAATERSAVETSCVVILYAFKYR